MFDWSTTAEQHQIIIYYGSTYEKSESGQNILYTLSLTHLAWTWIPHARTIKVIQMPEPAKQRPM